MCKLITQSSMVKEITHVHMYYALHSPSHPHLTPTPPIAALNTGVILWLQQFRAMFTKHALNSIRHIVAIVLQLLLPTIFVLLALVLVKITPSRLDQDPPRNLSVATSIPMNSDTKLFFADLRANASMNNFFEVRAFPYVCLNIAILCPLHCSEAALEFVLELG